MDNAQAVATLLSLPNAQLVLHEREACDRSWWDRMEWIARPDKPVQPQRLRRLPCHRSAHSGRCCVHACVPFRVAAMCWAIRAESAATPYKIPEPRVDSQG